MNRLITILVACVVGPLAVLPVSGVFFLGLGGWGQAYEFLLASLMLSYGIVVLVGVPFHLLATGLKADSLTLYLITGFVLPVLTLFAIALTTGDYDNFWKPDTALVLLLLGSCGMAVAGLFKVVADWTYSILERSRSMN